MFTKSNKLVRPGVDGRIYWRGSPPAICQENPPRSSHYCTGREPCGFPLECTGTWFRLQRLFIRTNETRGRVRYFFGGKDQRAIRIFQKSSAPVDAYYYYRLPRRQPIPKERPKNPRYHYRYYYRGLIAYSDGVWPAPPPRF